jgi:TolA-binding protein
MELFQRAVISDSSPSLANALLSRSTRRSLAFLSVGSAIFGTVAWPVTCQALGLGRLTGEPIIGEQLQLEVPLTGTTERAVDNECVTVRRAPDSIDADYFPRDLAVRIDRQAGSTRLLLTTQSALRQPLVEFRVSISCGYNLSHDFLLMAAPRSEPAAPAVVAATAPVATAATVPAQPVRSSAIDSPVVAPTTGSTGRLPDGIRGKNVVLDNEMTLEDLARRHFPGPLRQQRFMRWVAEANPQVFTGAKDLRHHRLSGGTELVIPDGVPPRRPGDHQGPLNPLGEPNSTASTAPPRPAPKPAAAQTIENTPTRTASAGSKDRLVVGGGSSAKSMKETIALVDQLTGMMEKQMNAQTAYAEKVQQLEATIGNLDKQVKGLESEAKQREAQWQVERQAEKVAREQQAEREWWQLLLAVVAGGVVGGALLWAFRAFFGRGRDSSNEFEDVVVAEQPAPAISPVPHSKPLTEFGWYDEPPSAPQGTKKQAPNPAPRPPEPPPVPPVAKAAAAPAPRNQIDFELPSNSLTSDISVHEPTDPATAAIELANIMTSMGLAQSAAETLVEHIRENPRESLPQWLKLLEIHRLNGNRTEFERSSTELRQHFNVQPDDWNASTQGRISLESYPHIRSQVVKLWRRPDCIALLRALLLDNREGTRIGFPLQVAEEILLLIAILNSSK